MKKLYLSPSSQENNLGPGNYNEEVVMNLIADAMMSELKAYPEILVMRNKRGNSYAGHIAESDAFKPDLHFALHSNALSGKARGCEIYCNDPSDLSSPGTQFSMILYRRISAMTPTGDRGIKVGTMAEVKTVHAYATLMEVAFHDNSDDALWITNHISEIAHESVLSLLDLWKIPYTNGGLNTAMYKINQALVKKKLAPLDEHYWIRTAVAGESCNGEYVRALILRVSKII